MERSSSSGQGRLFYLMGASGAGKDSLMSYARQAEALPASVLFAHRYITRPTGPDENHIALSEREFALRLQHGLFLLDWDGNGCRYGIGAEVGRWLSCGLDVVVNGSRAYLPEARRRLPALVPVLVYVSEERLVERLRSRARDQAADVAARIARGARYREVSAPDMVVLDNDGELSRAGEALLHLLRERPSASAAGR